MGVELLLVFHSLTISLHFPLLLYARMYALCVKQDTGTTVLALDGWMECVAGGTLSDG